MDKQKIFIRAEVMPIKQIKIRKYYRASEPSQEKIDRCLSFFFDNGYFEDVITLDRFGYLKDGYIKYLFLKYSGVEKVEVLHVIIKEKQTVIAQPVTPPEPVKKPKPTIWQRLRQDFARA